MDDGPVRHQPRRRERTLDNEPADAPRRRRFRHGQHLAFDRGRNYPLPNLFVSTPQRMGIEETGFGPSTGTMTGLEMA